ncbi:MAG: transglutaminaseTgpA domain-containing protein [Planctomycetota bacterium]
MSEALRLLFVGIVLLDLVFVQLTSTVSVAWLAGLWLFTALTPILKRWHERLWYRGLWNGCVLASFAFLVHDALTSGLLHMLEDGLLLSALCQVHLLNNLGQKQRPDLLFFNSFLIAFVTSFFCGDLAWSITFFLYAALLVPALQLYVALPRTGPSPAGTIRVVVRDGLPRSLAIVLITGLVFAVWPRDFRREGWLGDSLQFGGQPLVAFAEQVRLDRTSTPVLSDAPVMHIRSSNGRHTIPQHWRGATFVQFDGAGWQPFRIRDFGTRTATDELWTGVSPRQWRRGSGANDDSAKLAVQLVDRTGERLFLPQEAQAFEVLDETPAMIDPKADGVVALLEFGGDRKPLQWTVQVGSARNDSIHPLSRGARIVLSQLPAQLPQPIRAISDEIQRGLPAEASPELRANRARDWLSSERRYALPGTPGAARSLDDFLLGTGGGHCEFFATALALLLRQQQIPCRVVGGYFAQEWDESAQAVIVRQRHAHAWVEAFLPSTGWTTLDPTPAMADGDGDSQPSWLARLWDELEAKWSSVAGFSEADRRSMFAKLKDLPAAFAAFVKREPGTAALCAIVLGYAARMLYLRRHRNTPKAVMALRRAMRKVDLQCAPGETPRELLVRAQATSQHKEAVERLAAAVAAHEQERYAR